ncbi:MAG TPA: carbonic anhydrase [Alphaproteobacteria bacterium]
MSKFLSDLATRFTAFRRFNYDSALSDYKSLAKGQSPETLVIACIDSRVTPESLFGAGPGEILVARNIANLVPPYEHVQKHAERHGVSAVVEFAVQNIGVKNIVVLGHSACGGIQACLNHDPAKRDTTSFVSGWVSILEEPRERVLSCTSIDSGAALERAGIQQSLENLRSFPFVCAAEDAGKLALYGAHFDIGRGLLSTLDEKTGLFSPLPLKAGLPDRRAASTG